MQFLVENSCRLNFLYPDELLSLLIFKRIPFELQQGWAHPTISNQNFEKLKILLPKRI